MTRTTAHSSYKPAMILLGVITPICLLTGMTDVKYQAPKGEASLVNKYGDPMKIASTKNAGRLCRSQLELDYGSSLVESTINRQSTSFDQSRNMYLVTMNASVGTSDSWQQLEVNCHIKAQAITHSISYDESTLHRSKTTVEGFCCLNPLQGIVVLFLNQM